MKNKGFTLIELLAVIIILGILMLIAIPSVTTYINNSRKDTYVSTIQELIKAASTKVNSGELYIYDTDATYYIPVSALKLENGDPKSPNGKITDAYVVVTYNGDDYDYYYVGKDDKDIGINEITKKDKISKDLITTNVDDVNSGIGIIGTSNIVVFNQDLTPGTSTVATDFVDGEYLIATLSNIVCKRATTKHQNECLISGNNGGCSFSLQYGDLISYGSIVNGDYKGGDAFDCDVNADGKYDPETERFYYLTSDGDYSSLLYYKNINDQETYKYNDEFDNTKGPIIAYQYLPSITEWKNPFIVRPGTRSILAEDGGNQTAGGTIGAFTYTNKAARLLTYQEVQAACGSNVVLGHTQLDSCRYLLENVGQYESKTGSDGYWLETPDSEDNYQAWALYGNWDRTVVDAFVGNTYSVRPVITVLTSNIE